MAEQRREKAILSRAILASCLMVVSRLAFAQTSPTTWWADSSGDLLRWLTTPFLTIGTTGITATGLFEAAFVIAIALLISKFLRRGLAGVSARLPNLDQGATYTLGRILHYAILVVALFGGLAVLGVDLTKIAIVAGALGVGVGFGLQNIVNNFVSGLILLFERTIKVGDYIELASGITGEVRDINIRSTIITTNDNLDVVVPNSELVSNSVTNWTLREAVRRIRIPFGVAYGSDKERVRAAALEAASAVEHTLSADGRAPQVWLVGFGDSSLNFELIVWLTATAVKRPARIAADYNWELETALRKHGIEIPFPQRDIHVRSAPGLRDRLQVQGEGLDKTEDRP
ncbi:MAG: mechanosensitive ion channel domain-containing protein [Gammaproteobacteria bacterium]